MTGCYHPGHECIDNVIHTYAGVQLRLECALLMGLQGHEEPIGQARITNAYNLPSTYVIHTVGPQISGPVTEEECYLLEACYQSCLEAATAEGITSLALCCISTGVFHFPNEKAAEIAVRTVKNYVAEHPELKVVLDVYTDVDLAIYQALLGK